MPFSLGSYLLGVGTVVGALAFGFGGGVLMTKTAMKDAAPAQEQDAKENPAPPAEPARVAHSDPTPAAQGATPQPDTRAGTESAKGPEPKQPEPEPAKQAEPADQTQKDAAQKRAADRKAERQKHFAERKTKLYAPRTRQPPSDEQDEPERAKSERTEYVFTREEPRFFGREGPHFNLFRMFGPPSSDGPYDHDD